MTTSGNKYLPINRPPTDAIVFFFLIIYFFVNKHIGFLRKGGTSITSSVGRPRSDVITLNVLSKLIKWLRLSSEVIIFLYSGRSRGLRLITRSVWSDTYGTRLICPFAVEFCCSGIAGILTIPPVRYTYCVKKTHRFYYSNKCACHCRVESARGLSIIFIFLSLHTF